MRDKVMNEFFADEMPPPSQAAPVPKAERDALTELELTPPVKNFRTIKAQYRSLVKRHHPDANGGSLEAEEKFKSINQAFAMLKQIYGEDVA
jgi:DnaJ-domain-containing protein 1